MEACEPFEAHMLSMTSPTNVVVSRASCAPAPVLSRIRNATRRMRRCLMVGLLVITTRGLALTVARCVYRQAGFPVTAAVRALGPATRLLDLPDLSGFTEFEAMGDCLSPAASTTVGRSSAW